ncbi:lipase member H-like [Anopheles nili]|uniref:lipase member H-like n=1 Tax=Anopheles nili TaxID=185578 RepID=UPI00237B66B3|nr:lipase member H-like [Anopheles nili]
MRSVVFLVLLASVIAVDPRCGNNEVLVPRNGESFWCLSETVLQQFQQLERSRRFDAESNTRFFLWTQQTKPGDREELPLNDVDALKRSSFDPASPTRILIHGWLNDWTAEVVRGLSETYVTRGAYNVIGVDWSAGASAIVYLTARMRVGAVADAIAIQIRMLLEAGQHPSQIVLIGHSLGAHIAGLTGKHFQTGPKLAGIVALDPAGPLFSVDAPSERVDAADAQYVEVIHTDGGLLGLRSALGQADFFPNGGRSQPGCLTDICNHQRAVEYYRRSVASSKPLYVARRCDTDQVNDNCDGVPAVMGSDLNDRYKVKTSGLFYLAIGK